MSRREQPPAQQLEKMVSELKSSGMSFRDIAQAAHVSYATVWRAGAGLAQTPGHETFVRIETLYTKRCGPSER